MLISYLVGSGGILMELRNCPECGKVFTYIRKNLCAACLERDEQTFKEVKKYLITHPGIDIVSLSEATGVEESKILKYLKEGRIEAKGAGAGLLLECEGCGKIIVSGRFCSSCAQNLAKGFNDVVKPKEVEKKDERDSRGMAYIERRKND